MISYYADLAIGLALAFLLLSLLVSGINEGLVRLLGIRSKFLWAYLRDTLDGAEAAGGGQARDPERAAGALKRLGDRLRTHLTDVLPPAEGGRSRLPATVLGVFARLPFGKDPRPGFSPRPGPARGLAPAADAGGGRRGAALADLLHERLREIGHIKAGKTGISRIPPASFAVALMEIAADRGGVEALLRDLDRGHSPLYRPVAAVWHRVGHDLSKFAHEVENWFDGEMERLSLLYRRYVRWVVAVLGLIVTLGFGLDALEYAKELMRDSAYRAEVAAFAQAGPEALAPLRERCAPGQDAYACVTEVLSTPAFVRIFSHAPVTVTMHAGTGPVWRWDWGAWWDRLSTPGHWPGYLITAVSLLFGAPFWWDLLRRLSGFRSRFDDAGASS